MLSKTRFWLTPALFILGLPACETILGAKARTLDPINTANALPGDGPGGSASTLKGRVRVANLAVTPGYTDFCIRPSGTSSWGEPVMRNSGTDTFFRTGLAYPQVTIPFAAPVGTIDVKFIVAGETCAAPALSMTDGILVSDSTATPAPPVTTILRYGGKTGGPGDNGIPETIVGLPEETHVNPTCATGECPRFRVVNAAATSQSINIGFVANDALALPASVNGLVFETPVAPGHAPAVQSARDSLTAVDSSGYIGGNPLGAGTETALTFGVVAYTPPLTSTTAVAIFHPSSDADTQTLFLIGDPNNNIHPIQGLLVEDNAAASGQPDAGIDYPFLAKSTLTTPPSITVDTINTGLYGLEAPDDNARIGPTAAAIAKRQTDVFCLAETDFDADKRTIVDAAIGNFKYSYWVPTDITTPPVDSTDWYGNTPPLITTAPCDSEPQSNIDAVVACAEQCTPNGAADAAVTSLGCLADECATAITPMGADFTCIDCIVETLSSEVTLADMAYQCKTNTNDPYGQFSWSGQNGSLLLSRFPFATKGDGGPPDTSYAVLPASNFKRVALRARLQIDSTSQLDFYCVQFTTANNASGAFQYEGQYATPDAGLYPEEATNDNGWRDEQSLEARDLITWIRQESGALPAIVAGDWHSYSGYVNDAGVPILEASDPEVYEQLIDAGFVPAHPASYVPSCDNCNSNPYYWGSPLTTDGTTGTDWTTTFLYNFPPNSTLQDVFWGDDPSTWVVNIPSLDAGLLPLSGSYPRSVEILRP